MQDKHKIDISKKYKTRDGRDVQILCVDRKNDKYPVIALIKEDSEDLLETYTSCGRVYNREQDSRFDLIEINDSNPDLIKEFKYGEIIRVRDSNTKEWRQREFVGYNPTRNEVICANILYENEFLSWKQWSKI